MFAPTSLRLAAAIAAICYFHLFFYSTEGPVLTLTSAAVLFLPVYARKLEVPARHPIKTILYYLFCTCSQCLSNNVK
ncbi:hypothetical protein B0O80DRAFT_91855 [Mortierella sp. GBAus27b]|nr:hypothetical protein B0O80DRAFT_91855 [Mortierella sp. GBAus27b]